MATLYHLNFSRRKAVHLSLLLALLLCLSQCKKNDPNPVDQLPPATQTGANTFGCLVNGQAWVPRGNNGSSNYTLSYDMNSLGGVLDVRTYRYTGSGANDYEYLILFLDQIKGEGIFVFPSTQRTSAAFNNQRTGCRWSSDESTTTYSKGKVIITRLDVQAGVISGTFAFTLYKPGCDSIRVTNGRFDKRL